jgi:hypothetical protein
MGDGRGPWATPVAGAGGSRRELGKLGPLAA